MSDTNSPLGQSEPNTSGPGGTGWRAPSDTSGQRSTSSEVAVPPRRPGIYKASSIVGEVRGFQSRTESLGPQYPTKIIWTFRVERFDAAGNRLPPVPVEMRSKSFDGFINEGDQVEISGRWREGQIVRPRKLRNLTTGAMVKVRGIYWVTVIKALLFLVFLVIFVAFAKIAYDNFWRSGPVPVRKNGPQIKFK
jgi:hypothetical protein